MFRRILIANRGEVAARVLRTARRLGIETFAVTSVADREQRWLAGADRVVCLGGARAVDSYLDADGLIEVAVHHCCSAVHPGWGFLSENPVFAARVEAAGLTFIGPRPDHLRAMGDKALARRTMKALGLPVIPGSDGPIADLGEARRVAAEVGYPLLLKAVAGGGGRGMRSVEAESELENAFFAASAEARSAFGDERLYAERRIDRARHVEIQILGDGYGNVVHLGERECSLQRRHQKIVEESPSPALSDEQRTALLPRIAAGLARLGYRSAGTVEMLLEPDGGLVFMEMNTRLQVEHPVTEMRVGVDLVEAQLRIAANEPLPDHGFGTPNGAAIECRINAEDPDQDFRPCPGVVTSMELPAGEGIRVDTHLSSGDRIPPHYDSMVAKVIAHGATRDEALVRMRAALGATRIDGVTTNLSLLRRILDWDAFRAGTYDTTSLETWMDHGAA